MFLPHRDSASFVHIGPLHTEIIGICNACSHIYNTPKYINSNLIDLQYCFGNCNIIFPNTHPGSCAQLPIRMRDQQGGNKTSYWTVTLWNNWTCWRNCSTNVPPPLHFILWCILLQPLGVHCGDIIVFNNNNSIIIKQMLRKHVIPGKQYSWGRAQRHCEFNFAQTGYLILVV